jgi:HEAT repeat protein
VTGYPKPEVRELLLRSLKSESLRNELAVSAIAAMRTQDDPAFIQPLIENLRVADTNYTSRGLAQGLDTLGYLGRNEDNKAKVRQFLTGYANDPRERVQLAAFSALGTLGDPAALPILEKFANASKENPQQATAEKAVLLLRETRKPVDDFKNVRQEVLEVERANQDLKKRLDALEKKAGAREGTPNSPAKNRKSAKVFAPKAQ